MVEAIMDAKGLDKTHNDAVREISARVLAQLHQLAKRGRIQRIKAGCVWRLSWVDASNMNRHCNAVSSMIPIVRGYKVFAQNPSVTAMPESCSL